MRTHVSGSAGGMPTVNRLVTRTSNGNGSPAVLALAAQSVALPCGSMSLTSTFLPSLVRAMAVPMVLVVLPTPPFMFAMAMMRGTFVSLFSISVSFFSGFVEFP